jgi:hypothetical protein
MKHNFVLVIALLTLISVADSAQEKKQETTSHVTMPSPATPTIPSDAMFALGQQSIQLQAISARLDKMEPDISQTKRDVDRLLMLYNAFLFFIATVFTVAASYVVVRLIKKFWPEPPPPPAVPTVS